MSMVSVILPVYNSEKYLGKCISSVLSQTFSDFELLVIDDGSTDNSALVAKGFEDSRIVYYKKDNGGLSDARNYGLERAKGDFVYFLDADDWIEPDLLENALNVIEFEQLDFVLFGYFHDRINEAENVIGTRLVVPKDVSLKRGQSTLFIDGNHLDLIGYAWNKLYRYSFLKSFSPRFEVGTNLIEDVLFNTSVFMHSDKIRYIAKPYYHYSSRLDKSLLKNFYPDSFELIKRRRNAIYEWCRCWGAGQEHGLASYSLISGIRYCVFNLFGCGDNQMTDQQKRDYVVMMFQDRLTLTDLPYFVPDSEELDFFKKAIQGGAVDMICRMVAGQNRIQFGPVSEEVPKPKIGS